MSSASPRNAFMIAAIMILVSQSAFVFDLFDDSGLENESEIFESGSGSGGVSLSPASTTVTLTNNTAMSPITYQYYSGSGMENGVPVGIMLGGGEYQNMEHAIDSNDKHHLISYNGRVSTGLYYTTNSGGSWTSTMVDSGGYGLGYKSDIEVDSN
ncbi:MAG: hypothetical protein OSB30_07415, partial [Candidatus Poseidoniaceae archaeon]|nr:hypothetical protein [Candidatus Poseidoniaceae archaeon]